MPTTTCLTKSNGNDTRIESQISSLLWHSDAYAESFAARATTPRANTDKHPLSANTFEPLIDMRGADYPRQDASWKVLCPQWCYRPRIAKRHMQPNYDCAKFTKECSVMLR